ncbi:MAG: SurA N-terminal domain-containing protein [Treponema sp.]|jgi:phosphoserine phosphatase|nr:SurA N-terminal domain-containing protein [Treponema sp.]
MAPREKKLVQEENPNRGEWMRRFKANPFIFVGTILILIIVIVAFVVAPAIVPEADSGADLVFGYYNKVPISYVPGNYLANVQANYARYTQGSINESNYQTISQKIWQQAFEETVIHTAILQAMKQAGYIAPAAVVDREVAQMFQENGRFSAARYRSLSATNRMALWKEAQESIAKNRYLDDIFSLRLPSGEGEFVRSMVSRTRSFGMVSFSLDSYPDEEIVAYVESEPDLFRTVHLSRITITSSEREARQVLDSVVNGTQTFEEAARTQSQDSYAERGGDMGLQMAYELAREVPDSAERESVIATALGAYSPLVKAPSGWAFFRADEEARPADTDDPANLSKIRSYMRNFERGRMEDWLFAQARLLIDATKEDGFDVAVEAGGAQKRNFGPLPLNYGGVAITDSSQGTNLFPTLSAESISELIPAESNENFWRAAFFTPLETPSEPLVVGDNVLVLYPREEIMRDEADTEGIITFYSTWVSSGAETSLRSHFMNSDKLVDNFFATYLQYLLPAN